MFAASRQSQQATANGKGWQKRAETRTTYHIDFDLTVYCVCLRLCVVRACICISQNQFEIENKYILNDDIVLYIVLYIIHNSYNIVYLYMKHET